MGRPKKNASSSIISHNPVKISDLSSDLETLVVLFNFQDAFNIYRSYFVACRSVVDFFQEAK